jgi:ankyrin repeat protein
MVSAIWTTSSEGRLDELQELLKNSSNADVNVKDDAGVTPLIAAVKNGHLEVIQVLLAHGTFFVFLVR